MAYHPDDVSLASAPPQPGSSPTAAPAFEPFLMNLRNLNFARGQARYPAILWSNVLGIGAVVAFLVFMLATLGLNWITDTRVASAGRLTRGTVIARRTVSGKSTTYYLTFQYQARGTDNEPHRYQVEQTVSPAIYASRTEGAEVTIKVLPDDPATARLAGPDDDGYYRNNNLLGLVILVPVTIGLTIVQLRPIVIDRALARDGRVVQGKLLSRSGRMIKGKNRYFQVSVAYTFTSPTTGLAITGKQNATRNDLRDKPLPELGTPVAVLYVNDSRFKIL
ncbi:MAG TPA: DUF3592 domain-containing protein [Aggregatilineales bacterium]|nr:DUF3592 domain-containing protein [Aggregatilineales bacterium]